MMRAMLSLVIPTLNAEAGLPATLATLAAARASGLVGDVLITDGGSIDQTRRIAEANGCQVLAAPRGRGQQLATGAAAARGDWLLFLHADTRLAAGWEATVQGFMADPGNLQRAACFGFALDDNSPAARRLERLVAWRCQTFALPYGDQGLLLSRPFYQALGGYRPLPLMEDVDLVRRIGRHRLVMLDMPAITSAAKWQRQGYWQRSAKNLSLLLLYFLGLPPRILAGLYR